MADIKLRYFAYASNLLEERVNHTLGNDSSAKVIGPAKLQDYDLCFDYYSEEWKGCKATCHSAPRKVLWGVLWEVTAEDKALLARAEEVYLGKYREIEVDVTTPDGDTYRSFCYQLGEIMDANGLPSPQYKDVIVRGARQAGLPEEYINLLKLKPDNGYSGHVQIYQEILQSIAK
ncbi:gamma-glutamylcyclotransferase-like [Liolophura sinensis]|uniref:gamma-glutamylcyclotransferase-like n=1 Tax=Liolophura sinensis TaxID=3198878 RepID=UPI0031582AC4